MLKVSIHQEDITSLNLYSTHSSKMHKVKPETKRETDMSTILAKDCNTAEEYLSVVDKQAAK